MCRRRAGAREAAARRRAGEVVTVDGGRPPRGPRFGTLVHAALATVPLDAGDETIARIAATQARIVGAERGGGGGDRGGVGRVARTRWSRPRGGRSAGRCLRETPVTRCTRGLLVEGVVDLAFDSGEMTVVDFKTDRARRGNARAVPAPGAHLRGGDRRATGKRCADLLRVRSCATGVFQEPASYDGGLQLRRGTSR